MWRRVGWLLLVLLAVGAVTRSATAQVHMILIDPPSVKPGEKVTVTCVCGKPFTGERVNAEKPQEATAYPPTTVLNTVDLLPRLEKITVTGAGMNSTTGYRCEFVPPEPGDYVLAFAFPPLWLEHEERFLQDAVRVVLHVHKESGWTNNPTGPVAFVPMTRPYGLRERAFFQARLVHEKPERRHLVELEQYSPEPPAELPDPEFITLRFLTDDRGVASCTLPEPGWWVLSAEQSELPMTIPPQLQRGDRMYPVNQRAILLVFVAGLPGKSEE